MLSGGNNGRVFFLVEEQFFRRELAFIMLPPGNNVFSEEWISHSRLLFFIRLLSFTCTINHSICKLMDSKIDSANDIIFILPC